MKTGYRRAGLVAVVVAAALAASCAYFNTLYNARRIYGEAEEQRIRADGDERAARDKYEQVVTKCASLVANYPDSRWVDDALFLMGQALIRQGDLNKGIRKFQEIQANYPGSNYAPRSSYWLAYAYYRKRDYSQATSLVERFLEEHPKSDLRYDAMFLAGDIYLATENVEAALSYYARVAEESNDRDRVQEAVVKSAELYYSRGEWEEAAAGYEKVLRGGMSPERRREISILLGDCYTRIGRCDEAMAIFDRLLVEVATTRDQPPLILGRAASFVCMDSLESARETYEDIAKRFPKSTYSAEAFYRLGVIFEEKMDSLSLAQEAFSKVSVEYANSDFAPFALQKATSLKRLIELEESRGGETTVEQRAERRFLAAEIQLTRLEKVKEAIVDYQAVVDSFPGSSFAPRSAFAIAWIHEKKMKDVAEAARLYRGIARRFPRSPQARGAVDRLGDLGMASLRDSLAAFVDSVAATAPPVDTTAVDSAVVAPPVVADTATIAPPPAAPDTSTAVVPPTPAAPDTTRIAPIVVPDSTAAAPDTSAAPPDTARAAAPPPPPADTTAARPPDPDAIRRATTYPSAPDTSAAGRKGEGS
ncbi:MAG: tetratricopeptide repeat protein [Candidatus Krumholzibacteriota bacterium]|nr:tetratricopeptide repeat protein [Candidatus Krumholzibacteriota bacterium]